MYNLKKFKKMKKLIFGLVAMLVLSFSGNPQTVESNEELNNFINLNLEKIKLAQKFQKFLVIN